MDTPCIDSADTYTCPFFQVKKNYNLDLPDVKSTASQEMLDELGHMEKIYVTLERTIAKKEVPELIANAAERFKNNLTTTNREQHILNGFIDYSVPYLAEEVNNSSHNKYGGYQKGSKSTFDIPENPRSWEDILYTLSGSPVDETENSQGQIDSSKPVLKLDNYCLLQEYWTDGVLKFSIMQLSSSDNKSPDTIGASHHGLFPRDLFEPVRRNENELSW